MAKKLSYEVKDFYKEGDLRIVILLPNGKLEAFPTVSQAQTFINRYYPNSLLEEGFDNAPVVRIPEGPETVIYGNRTGQSLLKDKGIPSAAEQIGSLELTNGNYYPSEDYPVYVPRTHGGINIYAGSAYSPTYSNALNQTRYPNLFWTNYVKGHNKAVQNNPNFIRNWDSAVNISDFLNAGTGGLLNRLDPVQDVRLIYDWASGENVNPLSYGSSWWGNNGLVSNEFAALHPYLSTALNAAASGIAYKSIPSIGNRIATKGFIPTVKEVGNSIGRGVQTVGDLMTPSTYTNAISYRLPTYRPMLNTTGKVLDTAVGGYLIGAGTNNIYEGIRDLDLGKTLWGAADIAFANPYLGNGLSYGIDKITNALVFSKPARVTSLTVGGLAPVGAAAANDNLPEYEVEVDANGDVIYNNDGSPKFKLRDARGPNDPSNWIKKQKGFWEGTWDFISNHPFESIGLGLTAFGLGKGGVKMIRNSYKLPKRPETFTYLGKTKDAPMGSEPDPFEVTELYDIPDNVTKLGDTPIPARPAKPSKELTISEPPVEPIPVIEPTKPVEVPKPEGLEPLNPDPSNEFDKPWIAYNDYLRANELYLRDMQAYQDYLRAANKYNDDLSAWYTELPLRDEYSAYWDNLGNWKAEWVPKYNEYLKAHPEQHPDYANYKSRTSIWDEYKASSEYEKYLKKTEKVNEKREKAKDVGGWVKRNWAIPSGILATIIAGAFNGSGNKALYRSYNPTTLQLDSVPTDSTTLSFVIPLNTFDINKTGDTIYNLDLDTVVPLDKYHRPPEYEYFE